MQFRRVKRKKRAKSVVLFLVVSLMMATLLFLYFLNSRILPVYVLYAERQTEKVASYVVSKAINSRTTDVLDVNNVIEWIDGENNSAAVKINTDIVNRVRAETTALVKQYLEQAENGNLSHLPSLEHVEYDVGAMEAGEGIVFFVPLGQALSLPLIGNLGPKIPIRFHLIGNVASDVETEMREIGINNVYIQINIHIAVNVQFIVPFASKNAQISQKIPVAIGLVPGVVPHIYTNGEGAQPSIEVPIPFE